MLCVEYPREKPPGRKNFDDDMGQNHKFSFFAEKIGATPGWRCGPKDKLHTSSKKNCGEAKQVEHTCRGAIHVMLLLVKVQIKNLARLFKRTGL